MARVRQRGKGLPQSGASGGKAGSLPEEQKGRRASGGGLLPNSCIFLYLLLVALLASVALNCYWNLPEPVPPGEPNQFSATNARKHLEDITNLGIRVVGSTANEVHAKNLILRKVEEIRLLASKEVEIEVSVQYPSGRFYLDFLGGLTHIYDNVTNIVVRFSKKGSSPDHAFLINAHFDSALGSPAASDDAVSCATMLEVLRCLSTDPAPLLPDHALIFLFNGAEETILQASHGFITQHPWAKQIRAFLNLEAAGAGGKDIVFQTGPENPWLIQAYAKSVPHPFASVVAQEMFQSGVIPSDTDFRIFRDHGHIPGIDIAYFVNGYVYHTEHDVASRIPDSCIQRGGENVVALLKEVSRSPLLADPGADKHGKVIFFSLIGLTTVVYPERIGIIINSLTIVGTLLSIYVGIRGNSKTGVPDKPTFGMVLKTLGVLLFSWIAALGSATVVALVLTLRGHSMTWFARPLLIGPLYAVPVLLAMGGVHELWIHKNPAVSRQALERSSFLAIQLLWTSFAIIFTYLRVCSAFVYMVWTAFPLVFRSLLWDIILQKTVDKKRHPFLHSVLSVITSALAISLPIILSTLLIVPVFDMFVPLLGRLGTVVSPDVAIGVITAVLTCIAIPHVISIVVYASSARLKKVMAIALLLLHLTTLTLALSGFFFPYSGGEHPKPKRLYLQHTDRVFYNMDGTVDRTDTRVIINTFDILQLKPISDAVPRFAEAIESECDGVYCGDPYYFPLIQFVTRNWYLPAPKLQDIQPAFLKLVSVEKNSDDTRNFTFQVKFPTTRGALFISPRKGYSMSAWSLEKFVPRPNYCGNGEECYFVFYARGVGEEGVTFWMELKGEAPEGRESLDLVTTTHYLDPPLSETEILSELLQSLPDWVTTVAWTSTYSSWVF